MCERPVAHMGERSIAQSTQALDAPVLDMTIKAMGSRLFEYDRRILVNGIRSAFASWQDRLTAVIGLLVILGGMRTWFVDRPWAIAAWAGLAVGGVVGLSAGRLIESRLALHALDGSLAADALRLPTRQRYVIAWHVIGLAMLAVFMLVSRPSLVIVSLLGYVVGALIGGATYGLAIAELFIGKPRYGRMIRSWVQRPRAGIVGAAILTLSLAVLAKFLSVNASMAVAGVETAVLVLALTAVDHGVVRFLTIVGHGSWWIIARQARGAMLFMALAVPICALIFGTAIGGIVASASAAALLLMTMRILAYRLHGKRAADFLVSILVALLMLVAFPMPIIAPFVGVAIFWQMQRRAVTRTWLLA